MGNYSTLWGLILSEGWGLTQQMIIILIFYYNQMLRAKVWILQCHHLFSIYFLSPTQLQLVDSLHNNVTCFLDLALI